MPDADRVELPLLQELRATGGSDDRRFVAARLLRYFPQLSGLSFARAAGSDRGETGEDRRRFLRLVSRAAVRLEIRGELRRDRARLVLTDKGLRRAEAEALRPEPEDPPALDPTAGAHGEAERILVALGQALGLHAQAEVDTYDVVWQKTARAPRHSHVFEVQVRGNVDSALTRLKRAHETSRSRLFLIVADERDARFADVRLRQAFPELLPLLRVIGLGELRCLHAALGPHVALLRDLFVEG